MVTENPVTTNLEVVNEKSMGDLNVILDQPVNPQLIHTEPRDVIIKRHHRNVSREYATSTNKSASAARLQKQKSHGKTILNTYGVSKSSLHVTVEKNFSFGNSRVTSPVNAPVSKLVTEPN